MNVKVMQKQNPKFSPPIQFRMFLILQMRSAESYRNSDKKTMQKRAENNINVIA